MKNRNGIKNINIENGTLMFMGVTFPNKVNRALAIRKVLYDQDLEYSEARDQPLNT